MQIRVLAATGLVVGLSIGMSVAFPRLLGLTSSSSPAEGAPVVQTAAPSVTPTPTATVAAPTATSTTEARTATPEPRATLPPVFTPTPERTATPVATPPDSGSSGGKAENPPPPGGGPPPGGANRPRPTDTPRPSATPTRTPTSTATATMTPTATSTPAYDFVVTELKEIPHPEYRDTALIRGRLIDQKGQLVPGAYFEIRSDAVPQFVAVEPHGNAPADGTATFSVTRGRFVVRVLGGRSQYAGWMDLGSGSSAPLPDWEFTFQETAPVPSEVLVSPTPTFTETPVPTVASTPGSTGKPTPVERPGMPIRSVPMRVR